MFQFRFVIGLLIGFQFNIVHKVLNAPIKAENDLVPDYNAAEARSLFDKPDRSINGADAYGENELENIFINPEEMGPYFEGDIIFPDDQMFRSGSKIAKLWPNGVVPVSISPNFTQTQTEMIRLALNKLTSSTSLRFPNRTTEADYAHFTDKSVGCFSYVGHHGGKQIINLQRPNCFKKVGTIIHELLHTVGFYHEHARNDRDDYVEIMWKNIVKEMEHNFVKRESKIVPSVDLTYDYASVMHYSRTGFSTNMKKPTIRPLFNTTAASKIGQRAGLSPLDIKKVNAKYRDTSEKNQNDELELISFQFTSGNISLDLKYKIP